MSTVLQCLVKGNPLPTVIWYGPNNTVITDETNPDTISLADTIVGDRVVGFHIHSRLTIHPAETRDYNGPYKCKTSNEVGTFDEHEIQLGEKGNALMKSLAGKG